MHHPENIIYFWVHSSHIVSSDHLSSHKLHTHHIYSLRHIVSSNDAVRYSLSKRFLICKSLADEPLLLRFLSQEYQAMALVVRCNEMQELGDSWSARIDSFVIRVGLTRRLLPALTALVVSLFAAICLEMISLNTANQGSHVISPTSAASGLEPLERFPVDARKVSHLSSSSETSRVPAKSHHRMLSEFRKFDSIETSKQALPLNSSVRLRYAELARVYLQPFKNISRNSYMDYLHGAIGNSSGACSGCFLIQIKDSQIYVYDPLNVRNSMTEFRLLRMREAVYFTQRAVQAGIISNSEFLVSTTDGVACTSRDHAYRMGPSDPVPRPIFTVSRCNVSDNIPFPMVFTDILRRAYPDKFWVRRVETLREWDSMAAEGIGAQKHESHVWANKIPKAVFRGRIRIPAILQDAAQYAKECQQVGRTGLLATARAHALYVREYNRQWNRKYWLWNLLTLPQIFVTRSNQTGDGEDSANKNSSAPSSLLSFQSGAYLRAVKSQSGRDGRMEEVLDVQVSGKCGSETYKSDELNMEHQSSFKYSIYAEGNSFWADRLALQMFGSSAIIKQMTPCGMFFEPLLQAYEHYIPTNYYFTDLIRQVRWAISNDEKVQQIVCNARNFAGEYLSLAGVQAYADELLVQYTDLLVDKENIQIHPTAAKLHPLN